jgi:hypothetical protein
MSSDLALVRLHHLQAADLAGTLSQVAPQLLDDGFALIGRVDALRKAAAVEARELAASHTMASFPAARRRFAVEQQTRLEEVSRGIAPTYFGVRLSDSYRRLAASNPPAAASLDLTAIAERTNQLLDSPVPDGQRATHWTATIDVFASELLALIDELRMMQQVFAYEADVLLAHYQSYARFPKRRLPVVILQTERLQRLALGEQPWADGMNYPPGFELA